MTSTVAQSINPTSTMTTTFLSKTSESTNDQNPPSYHIVLSVIYSVVLLCGTISLGLMMHVMKSSSTSTTSIAVLNLIFAHFLFLITVPFRIYYYANNKWELGKEWCKIISSMIHIHMYMSFILYVIILVTRLLTFYNKTAHMGSLQRLHALIISALVWTIVLVVVHCVVLFFYGVDKEGSKHKSDTTCFRFGDKIESAKGFNYFISTFIIAVAIVLTALQANVLWVLYKKNRDGCTSQQEFGAQLKSLCFALIMVVCFVPYHIFRLYYLNNVNELENINEVFLSLTTFNCLDMLTFLGRRSCSICLPGR